MRSNTSMMAKLACFALLLYGQWGTAQQCSREAITAKYWQYRKTFNDHFVMLDRSPAGCVGNGITTSNDDGQDISCDDDFAHGYSLPATSIVMTPDGGYGMGDRNNSDDEDFFDQNCANYPQDPTINSTSYDGNEANNHKHNYIEYGSETPHQLGWYLTVLSTEYALLQRNGQLEEAQTTLDELFLALQAYRRLDITANCLVKKRYDEITADFEVENCEINIGSKTETGDCLCPEKYHNSQCPGDGKWHFDVPCKDYCGWQPDLSGYSGFFIREDATQKQEMLHDPSDDKWNVDLVGSSYAMSLAPPCTTEFSQTCYLEHHVDFLSSDQLYSIMMGLAMVKKYIPETATVTTCKGEVFHPLEIAQNIAKGLVELPQNSTRHVFWPGSDDEDCCFKAVKFGNCAGGNFQFLYAGVEYMYNYINPNDPHKVRLLDRNKFDVLMALPHLAVGGNVNFYLEAKAIGFDMGKSKNDRGLLFQPACIGEGKDIFLLMNDQLYPQEPNVSGAYKDLFKQMLCDAPCGGPCVKPADFDARGSNWPAFDCANTPRWTGQRWEGSPDLDWSEVNDARQFNGLDYMALYNLYMLTFPEEQAPFYNPEAPEPVTGILAGHLLGEYAIGGPTQLCPGESGVYKLTSSNVPSTIEAIQWASTPNFSLSTTTENPTVATNNYLYSPGAISATFNEVKVVDQHYGGANFYATYTDQAQDVCQMKYSKPVVVGIANYTIETDINHCQSNYWFHAVGPTSPLNQYQWEITADPFDPAIPNVTVFGTGKDFNYLHPPFPGSGGNLSIKLKVTNSCGISESTHSVLYNCINSGMNVRVSPNPAQNNVSVTLVRNDLSQYTITNPNGVQILIAPSSGGTNTINSQIYTNGQNVSVASLPNGVYRVFATAPDITPLSTTLVIMR